MTWLYKEDIFTDEMIGNNYGFVYIITNLLTNKKYIGKKLFYSSKTKSVKGKRKRYKIASDWKTYYGSNTELQNDVILHGTENFKREILYLCLSKGECSYFEAKEQFERNVLESNEYYNSWIMVRIRKSHIKNLNERISKTSTE